MEIKQKKQPEWYTGDAEVVRQREKNKKDKEIAENLEKKQLPKWKEVKLKRNFNLYVWDTVFSVWFNWHDYRFTNLSNNKVYWLSPWEEKTLWREWEIRVDKTDTQVSRNHLKLRVDDESNLFLCDNSKHWTFVDEVENREEKKEYMKCEKITSEEALRLKNVKKSKEAEYFYEKYKPENKINLGNWKVIYTTNVLVPDYDEIIGYIMDGDCIEVRMFYRSNSEGVWRACPWVRKDEKLSKWEEIQNYCYATTTKVNVQLWAIFDSLKIEGTGGPDPILDTIKGKDKLWYNILMEKMAEETNVDAFFSSEELWNIIASEAEIWLNNEENDVETKSIFSDLIQRLERFKKTWKTFPSLSAFIGFKDKNWNNQQWDSESVIRMYSKAIPSWLDYSHMTKLLDKSYEYKHEFLWTIHTDIYQVNWKWKLVNIFFSRAIDEPNLVWIDDIQYSNSEINSFWITKKSINAVPLVWKPCDYWHQTPYNDVKNPEKSVWYWSYADIRDLYQDNPIIKHYKKLECLL